MFAKIETDLTCAVFRRDPLVSDWWRLRFEIMAVAESDDVDLQACVSTEFKNWIQRFFVFAYLKSDEKKLSFDLYCSRVSSENKDALASVCEGILDGCDCGRFDDVSSYYDRAFGIPIITDSTRKLWDDVVAYEPPDRPTDVAVGTAVQYPADWIADMWDMPYALIRFRRAQFDSHSKQQHVEGFEDALMKFRQEKGL